MLGTAGLGWPESTGVMTGNWKNLSMFIGRRTAKSKTLERLTLSATALTLCLEEREVTVLTQYPFAETPQPQPFPGIPSDAHLLSLTGLPAGGKVVTRELW